MNKQITKEDMKDAVIEALAPFATAVQKDFQQLKESVHEEIRGVKVVVEQMDKKWDLVAEQYEGILERVEVLEKRG